MNGPNPLNPFPIEHIRSMCFIKNTITRPNIIVGDYTYYDDPVDPGGLEKNVLYHYEFLGDKLVIGRFCAIAPGVRFIMNGANHKLRAFTTYPFGLFGQGWEAAVPEIEDLPIKGDTVIGNDVWIGMEAVVMPGVHVGDGSIIAARSVVTGDIPPYSVVGGNPARVISQRFPDQVIGLLLEIKWWDWDIEKITQNLPTLTGDNVEELKKLL